MATINLNAEQLKVVQELDRNILLLASAGTGKTGTLSQRLAHIIASKRAKSEEILCLTFTNKGSREIINAVEKTIGVEARGVQMGTFHSFCLKILQEEGKNTANMYQEILVCDEDDCLELLRQLMPPVAKVVMDKAWFSLVGYIKEKRITKEINQGDLEEDYRLTITSILQDKEERTNLERFKHSNTPESYAMFSQLLAALPRVMSEYQRQLQDNNTLDFTDIIIQTYELFKDESIVKKWRKRYRYICIDEVQDTNELEYLVLKNLWQGNHILLCGDFFQTIYEWRGSIPTRLVQEYKQEFSPLIVVFYDNYRSTQTLFKAGLSVLKTVFPAEVASLYEKDPQCVSNDIGHKIQVLEFDNRFAECNFIYGMIRKIYQKHYETNGTPPNVCVLVRNNREAEELSREFEKYNESYAKEQKLNFLLVDQYKFFRRMEIKDALAFMKLALNPQDGVSAKRIVKKFVHNVGEKTLEDIESEACRQAGLKLTDFLNLDYFQKEPYADLIEGIGKREVVVFDVESTGTDTTSDEIIQIAAIRINEKAEVVENFERFIRPQKSVGSSELVHHFSDEYLQTHGEEASVVLADFAAFSANSIIVGHNVQYDLNIFMSEMYRHGLEMPNFKAVYDTLDIYRRFYPNEKNHKLEHLSQRFETSHRPSHNAMDDILATAELLIYAIDNNILPTVDDRRFFMRNKASFADMAAYMATLRRMSYTEKPSDLLTYIMLKIGLMAYYQDMGLKRSELQEPLTNRQKMQMTENEKRLNNLRQFYNILKDQESEELGLAIYRGFNDFGLKTQSDECDFAFTDDKVLKHGFMRDVLQRTLQRASLTAAEMDPRLKATGLIPIITVHQSKGSEFDYVFLACMEEYSFPSYLSILDNKLDEEKRLFYVALTRPKKMLYITYSQKNAFYKDRAPSSFLQFLPQKYIETRRIKHDK